jgi:hypothetical protein
MSHFAEIQPTEKTNIFTVSRVIVAEQDFFDSGVVGYKNTWIKTSNTTKGGIHYDQEGNPDGGIALRANYAGIGYIYDKLNDVFYAPQPYPSWTISGPDWIWKAPVSYPISLVDGKEVTYVWNEQMLNWELVPFLT